MIRDGALCINPINWKRDGTYAPVEDNLGSLVKHAECDHEHVPGLGDARVDVERGSVICSTASGFYIDTKQTDLFGPASLHNMDYGMFTTTSFATWRSGRRRTCPEGSESTPRHRCRHPGH